MPTPHFHANAAGAQPESRLLSENAERRKELADIKRLLASLTRGGVSPSSKNKVRVTNEFAAMERMREGEEVVAVAVAVLVVVVVVVTVWRW
jgi:pilus assembly protein TadC